MAIGNVNAGPNALRLPAQAARAAEAPQAAETPAAEPSMAGDTRAGAQAPAAASAMALDAWGDAGDGGIWTDPVVTDKWEIEIETPVTQVDPEPPPPDPPVTEQWNWEWPEPDPILENPEPEVAIPEPLVEIWSNDPLPELEPEPPAKDDDKTIRGGTFQSWGDPHEVSGDGLKFDNYKVGTFVAFRSEEGDLELQKRQARLTDKEHGIYNVEAGLKVGENKITYDAASNTLKINGKVKRVKPGEVYKLADGTTVKIGVAKNHKGEKVNGSPAIQVNSPKGDRITINDVGKSLNFEGKISEKRPDGSVYGSLGTFDADTKAGNDMRLPNGQVTQDVDAFLEAWRVKGKK